jgi:hypothetical protein
MWPRTNQYAVGFWIALAIVGVLAIASPSARAQEDASAVVGKPRKILDCGGGGWKDGQVQEPCILVNPKSPGKLVMFYAGMQLGGARGAIGKAWAYASDPFVWHEDAKNPFLASDPRISSEGGSLRLDSVLYDRASDAYWIYYTGGIGNGIHLATCPAGEDGYSQLTPARVQRDPANPILKPNGLGRDDETCVSQGAVVREKGRWYMFYSYRTAAKTLPGVRLATSSDGKRWTKQTGPDLLTAAPEQRYIEWHQVTKIGDRYVLLYEGYHGGTRWGACVATSSSLTDGWKKAPASLFDQTKWPGYSDATMFHVATPALYRIDGTWYLFFQGAQAGDYGWQRWSGWCFECSDVVRRLAVPPTN